MFGVRFTRCFALISALVLAYTPARGQLFSARPALGQLVNTSDLIVIGTFALQEVDSSGNTASVSGTVTVAEVLWGDLLSFLIGEVVGEEEVPVSWAALPGGRSPVEGAAIGGREGIWLLAKTDTDTYRADGPRYLALRYRARVVRALRQNRVIVRRTLFNPPSATTVDLLVRNARTSDDVVPDFRLENGALWLHPNVRLSVYQARPDGRATGDPLQPLEGRVLYLDDEAWTIVGSGEEYLVRLDLADLFDLDRQTGYVVELRIRGFGTSTLALPWDVP